MNRLIGAVLAVVVVLVLAIGAISVWVLSRDGDDGDERTKQTTEATATPDATKEDGEGTPRVDAGDAELRLAGADPITLDPALAGDAASARYIVEIFGGLVTLSPELKIVPDIAEEIPTRENGGIVDNPDGTVSYTFHLRDEVVFHNTNRLVTAEDFKYSLERTASPRTASVVAEAYLGDIVGTRDYIRGRADEITGIEVVDDFTLRITIDAPKPYFLAKLTYPTAFVVDRRQVESNPRNWTHKPNGTGPYKVKEWRLNERIILEANDRYHLGAPSIGTVAFLLAGGSILTMYENDEIDVASVGINDIERVLSPSDPLNAEYVTADELSIWYLGFNTELPPFDDRDVRRAFAYAIDREKIAEVVLKDLLPVANSIMPPGLPGHNPDAAGPTYDPERARQLLAESTYGGPDGLPEIVLTQVGGGATVGFDTQAMIEMWKQNLGVEVEIQQTEAATFFDDLDRGRYQLFASGWILDYPDPEDVVDLLFYSKSRQNNTRYSNPELDAVLEQARTEQDVDKRLSLYQEAEQIILDDAVWVPLYFGRDHAVVKPRLKNYLLPAMVIPRLRYASVEEE